MKRDKHQKNTAMIALAGAILVATNLGVWWAANAGAIAPVGNVPLWGAFVALNVASILWAVILLGLQPIVVSLSYVAGGFLAYKGVQGMSDISVAEVASAGAIYGAFGALAVGNVTTKVRLAFYNKKQVPFIFIIAGLLVLDAVLNSGISSAGGGVLLNAVIFPFILAGVVVGLLWSAMNRFGVGYSQRQIPAQEPETVEVVKQAAEPKEHNKSLQIEIPAQVEEEPAAAVAEETVEPEVPVAPAVKKVEVPAAEEREEEFFPLEIDKDEEFVEPHDAYGMADTSAGSEDPFSMDGFDSSLYASGAAEKDHGSVMVEEPITAVAVDLDEAPAAAAPPAAPAPEQKKQEEPKAEKKETPAPAKKEEKSGDWLNGHLDLINKLK